MLKLIYNFRRSVVRFAGTLALPLVALMAAVPALADTTYTPTDAGWGEALTVAEGETVIIDTGDAGVWSGSIANSNPRGTIIYVR